ncbi:hypothetical protein [Dermatophilus congolensis]|uniref:hypothetical protein n=1 Tax=Dermatophilus congolensis TaxID=1863 RepID=UPI001AAEA911|nr:hypothetical protein [Dermatophilus congolensis]MBO3142360.1 hypothetical protein [Dermatophilus congolensis]MBO3151351.1 hypothetical protein [Dermatophilus congolensis]MBO3161645.1 hypothetical protein [Dermatophilus congolensis]MBO3162637.1 hypothetical protein [Dermatophilus congolensis]MBO3176190.1 hypothetical protein [Dermatophilus congolensis]
MPKVLTDLGAAGGRIAMADQGVLLSTGRSSAVVAWAQRGIAEVGVASVEGWTLLSPAGPSRVRFPYDDPVRALAGRPVSMGMRPAIGIFRVGQQAAVTLHPRGFRREVRWIIWTPGEGMVPPAGLLEADIADVVASSGLPQSRQAHASAVLHRVLVDGGGIAAEVVDAVFETLALPGVELFSEHGDVRALPGVRVVTPREKYAREFEKVVDELVRERGVEEEAKE